MEPHGPVTEHRRFGKYLRRVREERKLSLDTVEEMSVGFPERITKSHLSRIENGQAVPTFPRMFTLSQIYGVPVASMAERFEISLIRGMAPRDVGVKSEDELMAEARDLRVSGRYREALQMYEHLLDMYVEKAVNRSDPEGRWVDVALHRVSCLVHLARFMTAKEECENLLNAPTLTLEQRAIAFHHLAMCCYRLGKFMIAGMAIDEAKAAAKRLESSDTLQASLLALEGNIRALTRRSEEAIEAFKQATRKFEEINLFFEACRQRLNLVETLLEVDRISEARVHLRTVLDQAKKHGYDRQHALALSSQALISYRQGDWEAAESQCLQSNSIARPREYYEVIFRNCYYLWKLARAKSDQSAVRINERTMRAYLSRVEDLLPEAREYRRYLAGGD